MSRIVVFDSGVGGLSIYHEVVKRCPNHEYIFVSDNQAFPYGTKTELELTERVLQVVNVVDREYSPDIFIVACNSASTIALPTLRANFDFPFVGVVPAIKPAAKLSQSNVIGLLATPGTIVRPYTQALIDEFACNTQVIKIGSSRLVELAEQKLDGKEVDIALLESELMPFLEATELDVVVLACTHFPLLNNELALLFNKKNKAVKLVDSGKAIANRVAELGEGIVSSTSNGKSIAAFTGDPVSPELSLYLRRCGLESSQKIVA